jgi:membrane protein YqaA with SNARE-associated domain
MQTLSSVLLTWGLPGLALIALLDSAGLAIPGGPDAVVMLLSWHRPDLTVIVVLVATLGSTGGNWLFYQIGRKGTDLALKRFDPSRRTWVAEKIRRNDMLTIAIAMLVPPPLPTKVFVLMAGAFDMRMRRFLLAVFGGRLVRYSVEAYLGVRFGDDAAEIIASHNGTVALVLAAVVVGLLVARHIRARGRVAPRPQ